MILRRVIDHFRKQEWTAIVIDFVIVVLGVFVGLQVNNWNAERADESAYQDAMRRLAEESRDMIDMSAETRSFIEERLSVAQQSIKALRECDEGPDAVEAVNRGLNVIRSARGPGVATLTIDQLVSDEHLLGRQSEAERAGLRRYHAALHEVGETAAFVQSTAMTDIIDRHPLIDFTEILDPAESHNKVDIRRARINAPVAQACKDLSFIKLFYAWERAHVFQLTLNKRIEATVAENSRALGLADYEQNPDRDAP